MARSHVTHNYDSEYFKASQEDNCKLLKLLFSNNSYLLKQKGITLYRQLKEIEAQGVHLDYSNVHKFKTGKAHKVALTYLMFFPRYWGISFVDLISCDFEARDNMLKDSV